MPNPTPSSSFGGTDWLSAGKDLVNLVGGVSSLFGGSSGSSGPKPFKKRILTPGYTFGGGQLTRLGGAMDQERRLTEGLGTLRTQMSPGFGPLSQQVGPQFAAQRNQAVGNLRSNLAQRGILGASFADNQIANAEAEFSLQESLARAGSFQREYEATIGVIQQQIEMQKTTISRELSELGISTSFLSTINQEMDKQAKQLADLAGQRAFEQQNSALGGPPMAVDTFKPKKKKK